jgi:hypothetical protein
MINTLINEWFDYQIWLFLQMKFMFPAELMIKGGEMETFMKQFTLNGIKPK